MVLFVLLPFYYYLSPLFNLALVYLVIRSLRRGKGLMTGFLIYSFTIALVLQIVPSGYNIVAERYTYVPYIGLAMMLGFLFTSVEDKTFSLPEAIRSRRPVIIGVFFAFLVIRSWSYAGVWRDLVSINSNISEQNPASGYAQFSAAFYLLNAGKIDEALRYAETAESLEPENPQLQFLKGKVYYQMKDSKTALTAFQRAQQLKSKQKDKSASSVSDYELDGLLSILYFESGQMDSSEACFTRLIQEDTAKTVSNYTNRAICRYRLNRFEEAVQDYDTALSLDQTLINARGERGLCLVALKRFDKACEDLQAAVAAGLKDYQSDLEANCR